MGKNNTAIFLEKKDQHFIKKIVRLFLKIILFLLFLWAFVLLAVHIPWVQNKLVNIATSELSKKFNSEIKVEKVKINFLSQVYLQGVMLKDKKGDTAIWIGELSNHYSLFSFRKINPSIERLRIDHLRVYLSNEEFDSTLNIVKIFRKNDLKTVVQNDTFRPQKTEKSSLDLSLKELDVRNFQIVFERKYKQEKLIGKAEQLYLKASNFKIFDSLKKLDELKIVKPVFQFYTFPSRWPPKNKDLPQYLSIPIAINLKKLEINNGIVKFNDQTVNDVSTKHHTAFNDLEINNININAEKVAIRKHAFIGNLKHLSAKDKSGLNIKHLSTRLFFSTYRIVARQLDFNTQNSTLRGFLQFDYNHMNEILRFAKKVKITSSIRKSHFDFDDLAYFISPDLPFVKNVIYFNSDFKGNLNNFDILNFQGNLNKNIDLEGNFHIDNLFPIQDIQILANLKNLKVNKNSIEQFYRGFKTPPNTESLGDIQYIGTYKGNFKAFTLIGNAKTALGSIIFEPTFFDFSVPNNTIYKGIITAENFDLATLIKSDVKYKNLNIKLEVDGKGFDYNTLSSNVRGKIYKVDFNGERYEDIAIDGQIKDKIFSGSVLAKDPDFSVKGTGLFSLSTSNPKLEMSMQLEQVNLKKLGITNKNILFSTNSNLYFTGKSIDEFIGSAVFQKSSMTLLEDGISKNYLISDATLNSYFINEKYRKVSLQSKEIQAQIQGEFLPSKLPSTLKNYLGQYFDLSAKSKDLSTNNLNLDSSFWEMDLSLSNVKNYLELFIEDFKDIQNGKIKARYYGQKNELEINGKLNYPKYKNFLAQSIIIKSNSTLNQFNSQVYIDSLYLSGDLVATPIQLKIGDIPNGLQLGLEIMNPDHPKFVEFNTSVIKENDHYLFKILPYQKLAKHKQWLVDPQNQILLDLKTKSINVRNLVYSNDNQNLTIRSNDHQGKNILEFDFENIQLNELISGIFPEWNKFKGKLDGKIEIENLLREQWKPIVDFEINDFFVDIYDVGNVKVKSLLENEILNFNISIKGPSAILNVFGTQNFSSNSKTIDYKTNIKKLDFGLVNSFLPNLVYNAKGSISSNLNLTGTFEEPQLIGHIKIDSIYTNVQYIHTGYSVRNHTIQFKPNTIELGKMNLIDQNGKSAEITGNIKHNNLKNFFLNIAGKSPEFMVMNTNNTHNQSFYGKVIANIAEAKITGIIGERIGIYAKGENLANTDLTIVFNDEGKLAEYSFFEFVDKKKKVDSIVLNEKKLRKSKSGVDLDINFKVNEKGKLSILLNPSVDDRIVTYGKGEIAFKMNPTVDMDIQGSYILSRGTYLFTYQNFIQRTFYIEPDGVLQFLGDPYLTKINANAKFSARASAQELVNSFYGNTDQNADVMAAARAQVKAIVTLKLTNTLMKPDITYDIDIEQNNPMLQNAFESIKSSTRNNENEMNRQVFALLALQRFLPPNYTGFESASVGGSDVSNTAFDLVANKISNVFTEWIQNTVSGLNFDLKYRNYQHQFSSEIDRRNEVKLALSKQLFGNRLTFNTGGSFDFGQNSVNNSNGSFFGGDIDIEYKITPSGNLRGKLYSRLDNDILNSRYINKTGVSLNYGKDFDNLLDFLRVRRRKKIEKTD